jgi:hypothetical protein
VLGVGVLMHRRRLGIVGQARLRSASFPCLWRSKHVLEGHRSVIINDRVMLAAVVVEWVGWVGSLHCDGFGGRGREREMGCFGSTEA